MKCLIIVFGVILQIPDYEAEAEAEVEAEADMAERTKRNTITRLPNAGQTGPLEEVTLEAEALR